jgi:uncharacterized membrane protein
VSGPQSAGDLPSLEADLAAHVQEAVETIASLHRDHHEASSRLQRATDWVTARLGRPAVMGTILIGMATWIGAALVLTGGQIERPPFVWLELAATLSALVIAMLILVTQARQEQLVERRDQLTLELAILNDRKLAKIIALIEELRRDAPDVADRHDKESEEMATPADPNAVMAAIDQRTPDRAKS